MEQQQGGPQGNGPSPHLTQAPQAAELKAAAPAGPEGAGLPAHAAAAPQPLAPPPPQQQRSHEQAGQAAGEAGAEARAGANPVPIKQEAPHGTPQAAAANGVATGGADVSGAAHMMDVDAKPTTPGADAAAVAGAAAAPAAASAVPAQHQPALNTAAAVEDAPTPAAQISLCFGSAAVQAAAADSVVAAWEGREWPLPRVRVSPRCTGVCVALVRACNKLSCGEDGAAGFGASSVCTSTSCILAPSRFHACVCSSPPASCLLAWAHTQELPRLRGHRNDIVFIEFSHRGDGVATASRDATITVRREGGGRGEGGGGRGEQETVCQTYRSPARI